MQQVGDLSRGGGQPQGFALLDLNLFREIRAYSECGQKIERDMPWVERDRIGPHIRDTLADGSTLLVVRDLGFGIPPVPEIWTLGQQYLGRGDSAIPVYELRLSPDRTMLAYAGAFSSPRRGQDSGIFVQRFDENGLDPRCLHETALDPRVHHPVSWRPDSKSISTTVAGRVVEISVADGRQTIIDDGCCPKWSPDGKWIAYVDPDQHLVLRNLETGEVQRPLPKKKLLGSCLEWSPDMRLLSVCELPASQPDPRNRVLSIIGVLNVRDKTYQTAHETTWGKTPQFRWVRAKDGDLEPLLALLKRIHEQK